VVLMPRENGTCVSYSCHEHRSLNKSLSCGDDLGQSGGTWLLRVGAPDDHRCVLWPILGGLELPAALSSRFTRSA
jgi:hypothetical protein